MRITVIVENTSPGQELAAKHGLSLLVDTGRHRILFDFGPEGAVLEQNAEALGIDLREADIGILSHGHSDHGGGMEAFLEKNKQARVYMRPDVFQPHFSIDQNKSHFIGVPKKLRENPRVVLTPPLMRIDEEVLLFTSPCGSELAPLFNGRLMTQAGERMVPDDFAHEQSMILHVDGKWVLVGGCAHGGILNLLNRAEELAGTYMDAVISGFHLYAPRSGQTEPRDRILQLSVELKKRPSNYFTCHCTGEEAYRGLREAMGEQIQYISTGDTFEI